MPKAVWKWHHPGWCTSVNMYAHRAALLHIKLDLDLSHYVRTLYSDRWEPVTKPRSSCNQWKHLIWLCLQHPPLTLGVKSEVTHSLPLVKPSPRDWSKTQCEILNSDENSVNQISVSSSKSSTVIMQGWDLIITEWIKRDAPQENNLLSMNMSCTLTKR